MARRGIHQPAWEGAEPTLTAGPSEGVGVVADVEHDRQPAGDTPRDDRRGYAVEVENVRASALAQFRGLSEGIARAFGANDGTHARLSQKSDPLRQRPARSLAYDRDVVGHLSHRNPHEGASTARSTLT
jgi:hypothetical protein